VNGQEEVFSQGLASASYYDRLFDTQAAKIMPGEFFVTRLDMMVVTVLGSCVSACIRDRVTGIGGMNHFMLPGEDNANGPVSVSARYGVHAMEMLVNRLLQHGAQRQNLEAKAFGGGKVLRGFTTNTVGIRNANFVLHFLKTERIPLVASDLLDVYPRKVCFFPKTGRVLVRKLKTLRNNTIIERERNYESRLRNMHIDGGVELF